MGFTKILIMKRIVVLIVLQVSFSSLAQSTLLNRDMIDEKYPNSLAGYFDKNGELLFDGEAAEWNITNFKNHRDFNKIYSYDVMNFEYELLRSNSILTKYYCDSLGKPISIKTIYFKDFDKEKNEGVLVGTEIIYTRDGKIKQIIHH